MAAGGRFVCRCYRAVWGLFALPSERRDVPTVALDAARELPHQSVLAAPRTPRNEPRGVFSSVGRGWLHSRMNSAVPGLGAIFSTFLAKQAVCRSPRFLVSPPEPLSLWVAVEASPLQAGFGPCSVQSPARSAHVRPPAFCSPGCARRQASQLTFRMRAPAGAQPSLGRIPAAPLPLAKANVRVIN